MPVFQFYTRPPTEDMKLRVERRGLPEGTKTGLTPGEAKQLEEQGWQIGSSRLWGTYAKPPGTTIDRAAEAEANKLIQQEAERGGNRSLRDLINADPYGVELDFLMRDAGLLGPTVFLGEVGRQSTSQQSGQPSLPPTRYTQPPSGYAPSDVIKSLYPGGVTPSDFSSLLDQGYTQPYPGTPPTDTGNKGESFGQTLGVPSEIQPMMIPSRQQEIAPALGMTENEVRQELGRRLAQGDLDYMISRGRIGEPIQSPAEIQQEPPVMTREERAASMGLTLEEWFDLPVSERQGQPAQPLSTGIPTAIQPPPIINQPNANFMLSGGRTGQPTQANMGGNK